MVRCQPGFCGVGAYRGVNRRGSDIERELEYISDVNMFFQVVLNSLPDYFDVSVYGEDFSFA